MSITTIAWNGFMKMTLRVVRNHQGSGVAEARKSAYKLLMDFGQEVGQRKSSPQIAGLYTPDRLVDSWWWWSIFHPSRSG
ncbi:hypothetical protein A8E25_11585 [Burkholderia cenocepacia]|jgi:tRNA-binding protein|nr:putative t-RNA-binding region [Burkholderia cepacia]ONR58331.1 hypothetical protein A8E17_17310 [Burkholderia cenocepacia]VWB88461.1 putative chaperone CsaA [Burkholderia pseudomultivorans]ONR66666.1 hypothetical protein A8E17_02135 [Burkholderia cenocepacia]ONR67932.1 hypothetical protein A8E18_23555 [Burkholderia cenocepacia]